MCAKIAISALVLALAAPAFACDMHGGGWFGTSSAHWQNFNPQATYQDPAFLGDSEANNQFTPLPVRPAKPSFSNAADRASKAAKAKLAMLERSEEDPKSEKKDEWKPKLTVRQSTLEADAQAVR